MGNIDHQTDVLVLGSYPCGSLAAALLKAAGNCEVIQIKLPNEESFDRLLHVNPELFDLHDLIKPLKKKIASAPSHGLRFLDDNPPTATEYISKTPVAHIVSSKDFQNWFDQLAADAGCLRVAAKSLRVDRVDESGVSLEIDGKNYRTRLIVACGELPTSVAKALGIDERWDDATLHRYTFLETSRGDLLSLAAAKEKAPTPMSLDLCNTLCWAWMLRGPAGVHFAVEHPLLETKSDATNTDGRKSLNHWLNVLSAHGMLKPGVADSLAGDAKNARHVDLPFAGALTRESVANRTLLIGRAGGFITACGEEAYPACWSAIFAADTAKRALKEIHLQDALQNHHSKWGGTLGNYLRGPQQNLRFLLPLIYKNKAMTARLAEAILTGESVIR